MINEFISDYTITENTKMLPSYRYLDRLTTEQYEINNA